MYFLSIIFCCYLQNICCILLRFFTLPKTTYSSQSWITCSYSFPCWLFKLHTHYMTPLWSHPHHCTFIFPFCRVIYCLHTYCATRSHVVAYSSLVQGIHLFFLQYPFQGMHILAWGKVLWYQCTTRRRAALLISDAIKKKEETSYHTSESLEDLLIAFL